MAGITDSDSWHEASRFTNLGQKVRRIHKKIEFLNHSINRLRSPVSTKGDVHDAKDKIRTSLSFIQLSWDWLSNEFVQTGYCLS